MAHIEGFHIANFKALKNVRAGYLLGDDEDTAPLSPLTIFIGRNGAGKSALLDVFGFLADCLKDGIDVACGKRGGFSKIVSQGQNRIDLSICYRDSEAGNAVGYTLMLELNSTSQRPCIVGEIFLEEIKGAYCPFLIISDGNGIVWKGYKNGRTLHKKDLYSIRKETEHFLGENNDDIPLYKNFDEVELADPGKLAIATLGQLKEHPRIVKFRQFMENWYLGRFNPDEARSLPMAGPQPLLNTRGDNLGNVVQFMEKENKAGFDNVLKKIAQKIPGINTIKTETAADGRLLLCFNDRGFQDPFFAQQMSDGTLKLFAYLLLLKSPTPPSLMCIDEPENGLYHDVLPMLVDAFRTHARKEKGSSQVFLTTHQPYLLDEADPEEVWVLKKQRDGFSAIKRASDIPQVKELIETGENLGELWFSNYLN